MSSTPSEQSPSDVALFLKHAYGLIEGGWVQGRDKAPLRGGYAYCLVGALRQAEKDLCGTGPGETVVGYEPAREAVARTLRYEPGLSWWNDRPVRTQAEVLDLLSRAIKEVTS